jgi:hypothetical protein
MMKNKELIFVSKIQWKLCWFLFLVLHPAFAYPQVHTVDNFCISVAEEKFAATINQFRKANRLSEIPLSVSLSYVAKTHVADLQLNRPDTCICTTGSWSNKGIWKACCYNSYLHKPECTWEKPKELTNYSFRGYEIVYMEESILKPDSVVSLWFKIPEIVDFLLGRGTHSDKKWSAMGIGIGENYLSLWLGQRPDPNGKPTVCSQNEPSFRAPFADRIEKNATGGKVARYYIIYGVFNTMADAQEAVLRFKNNGFNRAVVVTKDNKIRVALNVFDSLKEAIAAKENLGTSYSDSWILKD